MTANTSSQLLTKWTRPGRQDAEITTPDPRQLAVFYDMCASGCEPVARVCEPGAAWPLLWPQHSRAVALWFWTLGRGRAGHAPLGELGPGAAAPAPSPRRWVARDIDGSWLHSAFPHANVRTSVERIKRGLPFAAYCCWNGMLVGGVVGGGRYRTGRST